MKSTTIFTLLLIMLSSAALLGQVRSFDSIPKDILERLPEMGKEVSPFLTSAESQYFNAIFKDDRKDFDFTEKKLGFVRGSNAGTVSNKKAYFDGEKERLADSSTTINSHLYIFNSVEKEQSGGFDAVIVCWSKILVSHKDLVERLKALNPK